MVGGFGTGLLSLSLVFFPPKGENYTKPGTSAAAVGLPRAEKTALRPVR
jgi:hypothetical protein